MSIAEKLIIIAEKELQVYDAGKTKGVESINIPLAQKNDSLEAVLNGGEGSDKSWYDKFWDAVQDNGKRTNYYGAFGYSNYKLGVFKPKYPLQPTSANRMFVATTIELGDNEYLEMDLSKCTDAYWMFRNTKVKRIGKCDLTMITTSLEGTFSLLSQTTEIKEIVSKSSLVYSNTFMGSSNLEKVTFSGEIGSNLSLNSCTRLTHDSLMSVINCLIEVSSTKTLTLGTENLAKLTDAEKAIATDEKGWTLT